MFQAVNDRAHNKIRVVRNAGPFLYAFGYFPLILGWTMAFLVFRSSGNGEPVEKPGILVAWVTLMTIVGLAVLLTRLVVSIDKNRGQVVSWWGLLIRFNRTRYALENFDTLSLVTELVGSHPGAIGDRFHRVTYYAVYLAGPGNAIKLKRFSSQAKAVALARKVNRVVGLKVNSDLGLFNIDYPVQRADDKNSAAKFMRGLSVARTLAMRRQGDATEAVFPLLIETRWLTRNLFALALALVAIVYLLGIDYLRTSGGHYFIYFIAFFAVMVIFFLAISHRKRHMIVISGAGIELFTINLLGYKKRLGTIPRDEIQELSAYRDTELGVKGTYQSIRQSTGLTSADLDTLYNSLAVLNIRS